MSKGYYIVNERFISVYELLKSNNIIGSKSDLAQKLDTIPQNIYDLFSHRIKISSKLLDALEEKFNVNKAFILLGNNPIFKNSDIENINEHKYKSLPVYNLDAVGGLINQEVDIQEFKIGEIPFLDAQEGDICIPISGDSMFPTYKPTTYVQIRKIENWKEYIEAGNIYVLVLNDGRRLIKEIRNSQIDKENYFLLHSHNPNYEQQEIPKKLIASIWIVVSRYIRDIM
ncbi:MAG: helix-turn-helix transcriptional regulator [Bacteroidales bacterium]